MASYIINWTDASLKKPFTVSSKTTDNTHSSLTLIGATTIDWGKEYQENLLHLLENFASNAKPPLNPTIGQLWFNSADNYIKVYSSTGTWDDLKHRGIDSRIAPVGKFIPGDLWYDSGNNQLKVYLNEGLWSDPMSGSITIPRPVPVPSVPVSPPTVVTPTPATPVAPTPTPVSPTPAPTSTPMQAHSVEYYGPAYVWGLNGVDGTSKVAHPVPSLLADAFSQITVSNQGVIGNDITKLINGTDGIHRSWDFTMSNSTAQVIIIGAFGYPETTILSPSQWQANLTTVIQTAQKYNKLLIFVSMHKIDPSIGNMHTYAQLMQTTVLGLGAAFIDMEAATNSQFTGSIGSWLPDGVTPNQNAYNVIGQQLIALYPAAYQKITGVDTSTATAKPFGQDAKLYPSLTFAEDFPGSSLGAAWKIGNWYETTVPLNNYSVGSGALTVWAQKNASGSWSPHNFTCTTDGAFYQRYGYFEIEAKLPYGSGVWPAFWMQSHDDSTRPQINLMETWPSDVTDLYGDSTFHPKSYVASVINGSAAILAERKLLGSLYNDITLSPDLSAGFHKYGVRWDSSGIQFYFDGQPLGAKVVTNALTTRMFFVIDLWIGGKAASPDITTPTTPDRGMVVNYFRAWSLSDGTSQISGTAVTPTPVPTPVVPTPGVTPTPIVPTPGVTPTPVPTVPTPAAPVTAPFASQFHVGMHSHRLYNGGGSPEPSFNYGIIRDWDITGLHDAAIWLSDGSINSTLVRAVYDGHAKHGAKVLKCFGSVPQWAAKRPNEANPHYPSYVGSLSGPANLAVYQDYCTRFITTFRSYLYGVEGWNEPYGNTMDSSDPDWPQFTTMPPTDLADCQKALYLAAKSVDPTLPVFSPALSYLGTIPQLLTCRTSQNEPIWKFFDVLGGHLYNHTSDGVAGPRIADRLATMKSQLISAGATGKFVADTEHGWLGNGANYNNWVNASSDAKGQILYNTAKAGKDAGAACVVYYGYDDDLMGHPDTDPIVASWMGNAYKDWDTRYTTVSPTPSITTPTPTAPTGVTVQPFGQNGTYTLTFSDEFDSGSLNQLKWNDHIWYESSDPIINYKQQNGSLFIWPSSNFVNRTIDTDGKFSQLYGYFEMEAKLPIGLGCWPAFWLYGHYDSAGNKARPEIDIMEAYPGGGPSSGWGDSNLHPNNYGITIHEANIDYSYHNIPFSHKMSDSMSAIDLSASYHKYAVKWESNGITFYFDGQPLGSKWIDSSSYFDQPMYVLLDLWFGSSSGTPNATTPTGISNSYEVRYVRCWSFGSTPTPVPTPTPTVATNLSPKKIAFYGDSTMRGAETGNPSALAPITDPQAMISALPSGFVAINEGVNSSHSDQLLAGTDGVHPAWSTQMQNSTADVIIINHGSQFQPDIATYKSNLHDLATIARSANKFVIFQTPSPTQNGRSGMDPVVTAMKQVASSDNVPIIDVYEYLYSYSASSGKSISVMIPDGYHPADDIYVLIGKYAALAYANIAPLTVSTPTPAPAPTPTAPTPAPTPIVDYYGDSTIYGTDGQNGGRVAQPAPAVFSVSSGYVTRNEGVSRTSSTQLLNGSDGVHPTWDVQMSNTTATHVIINHAINDWQLNVTQYKANLQQLITIAQNHGKKVILETPNPTFQTLSGGSAASDTEVSNKAQYMREVSFATGVGLIDQFKMLTDYMTAHGNVTKDLIPDGLHPNQATYTLKGQYAVTRFAIIK
jgi:beta-glucanase (GH16 family)/lysophospholipase L1-like esterase